MFFFIKPSVIHLDCFTYSPRVYEYFPIQQSTKLYPDWWKKLPKYVEKNEVVWHDRPTMKSCYGFLELYKNSISIPMWSDLLIKISNRDVKWQFADLETNIITHEIDGFKDFVDHSEYQHLKFVSPWVLKTKKDINWMWTYPTYNLKNPDDFVFLPGIINYKYQHTSNINLLVRTNQIKTISLNAGIPIASLIPMSDSKVKVHNHSVDRSEYEKVLKLSFHSYFTHNYSKHKKILQERESKCPFGFGNK